MINYDTTKQLLDGVHAVAGNTIARSTVIGIAAQLGLPHPGWYIDGYAARQFRAGRGQYNKPTISEVIAIKSGYQQVDASATRTPRLAVAPSPASVATMALKGNVLADDANTAIRCEMSAALGVDVLIGSSESVPYVPTVNPNYVPWGHFEDIATLISNAQFLPIMLTGPSGNGKTDLFEQVCAKLGREYVRINVTSQTDEDDLLGGMRLVNGETKFALGPIPLAMLRGAFCNIDEIDLGSAAIMCLQPVLEGKPLYLKKIGRYINPAPGFSIGATSNTKGRGDDGRYAHTAVMNDAMLERFVGLFEQTWPEPAVERSILSRLLKSLGKVEPTLVKHLVEFAGVTRANFAQQICNDEIATRRLLHIARVFCALGSIDKAMAITLARFDTDTSTAFRNLWNAIHESANKSDSPSGRAIEEQV